MNDKNVLGPEMMQYYQDFVMKPIDFGERTLQWMRVDTLPSEGEEVIVSIFCDDGVTRSMHSVYRDGLFWVSDKRSKQIRYWAKLPEPASMVWPRLVRAPFEDGKEADDLGDGLSLNTLRDAIYEDAVAHGLWEGVPNNESGIPCIGVDIRFSCFEKIEDECDELERACFDEKEFIEELADVIIMSMSVAGKLGIDIDAAIRRKMEINKKRPWKHGRP